MRLIRRLAPSRGYVVLGILLGMTLITSLCFLDQDAKGAPNPDKYWQVDDVRMGMKGEGRTVIKGIKIEKFDAEVLGVLRNTSPGRDMILCRLSGLDLERTGVIAGMSGSPVYIDGKLLGAVALPGRMARIRWPASRRLRRWNVMSLPFEKRDLAEKARPTRIGLTKPLSVGGQTFDTVSIANDFNDPQPIAADR